MKSNQNRGMGTRNHLANRLAKKVAHLARIWNLEQAKWGANLDSNQDIAMFFASTRLFIAVSGISMVYGFSDSDRQLCLRSFKDSIIFLEHALQNPNWLTAPFCCRHLTPGFKSRNIHSTGAPARFSAGWLKGADERACCSAFPAHCHALSLQRVDRDGPESTCFSLLHTNPNLSKIKT